MAGHTKLDRAHLIQIVKDPDFYLAVPGFLYLRDVAMVSASRCGVRTCCGGDWVEMRGVVDAAFMKLREWVDTDNQAALQDVRNYLTTKKGYAVKNVVIYYRRSRTQGRIAKLSF